MRKDFVYLVLTDVKTNSKYKIGILYKENGKYYFKYILDNVEKLKEKGLSLFIAFPKINELYENLKLFPVFSTRLPDRKRPDIKKILNKYNMSEYDEFELLKRSGAKLPTDNYEFVCN